MFGFGSVTRVQQPEATGGRAMKAALDATKTPAGDQYEGLVHRSVMLRSPEAVILAADIIPPCDSAVVMAW